jgi:hypothetical protein
MREQREEGSGTGTMEGGEVGGTSDRYKVQWKEQWKERGTYLFLIFPKIHQILPFCQGPGSLFRLFGVFSRVSACSNFFQILKIGRDKFSYGFFLQIFGGCREGRQEGIGGLYILVHHDQREEGIIYEKN